MTASAPLVAAVVELALAARAAPVRRPGPVVVGLSGPQGGGKSTIAAAAAEALSARGLRAIAVSIDDFYLRRPEQEAVAAAHPDNPYLEHRGYPGTHDVALGARTLAALREAAPGARIALPAYDKSAFGGRGDRLPRERWPVVVAPVDVVILEGWMLGFPPVDPALDPATRSDPHLAAAARHLPAYAAWTDELDAFAQLSAAEPTFVLDWRVDAERARRAAGAPGLSDDEARDYVSRFLPAYALWGPLLRACPPRPRGRDVPRLHATLGHDREPLAIEVVGV